MTSPAPRVVLVTRTGCHLCEAARTAVEAVVPGGWAEVDVDGPAVPDDRRAEWSTQVPVVLVDGEVHDFWRVDERRLRRALRRRPGGRLRPW